jgi:hypothetical protein
MFMILRKIILPLALVYAALWGLTVFINYPNPVAAVRLGLATPSDTGKLMPAAEISALRPTVWEKGVPLAEMEVTFEGEKIGLYDFLEATQTNAFLVIKNDQIISEIYSNGFEMNHRFAKPKNYFFMRRRIKAIPLRQRREVKAGSGTAAAVGSEEEIANVGLSD